MKFLINFWIGAIIVSISIMVPMYVYGDGEIRIWERKPSFEEIYGGYDPPFSREGRAKMAGDDGGSMREEMKYSRQANYMNVADV